MVVFSKNERIQFMKKQLLLSLSLLLVATPAFASEDAAVNPVALPVAVVVDAPIVVAPTFAQKAKAFWAEKSANVSQWAQDKKAAARDAVVGKANAVRSAIASSKNAVVEKATAAKEYAQAFWAADRETKKAIIKFQTARAQEFARNNKLNLGASAVAAIAAYNVLSFVPVLKANKADGRVRKYAKVGTKVAASSALFAYLVATQRPDQAANWVKGLLPKKAAVAPVA